MVSSSYAPECRDNATCISTDASLCPVKHKNNGITVCKNYSCSEFDFKRCSKYRSLKVGDFELPAKGIRPPYCGRSFVYAVSETFDARKDLYSHCNTLSCPSCGILSELQHRFALVVLLWTYALYSGQYPSWGFASMDFSEGVSVEAIRLFRRNLKDRLERFGITAGTTIFHPYRIKPEVQRAIRKLTGIKGNDDSEAFWNYIRDDHKAGNLQNISKFLGIEINSIYDCLVLAPHFHFFIFPGNVPVTGVNPRCKKRSNDIFIQRLSHKVNGKRRWELRSRIEIYKQVTYLYSHVGQLADNRYGNIHIESSFGELFRWHPDKHVSFKDLEETRDTVLEYINEGREVKLTFNEKVKWEGSAVDDTGWIPLSKLRDKSPEGKQAIRCYIKAAKSVNKEHAEYLNYLIGINNFIHNLRSYKDGLIPKKWRKLWVKPMGDLPEFMGYLPPRHLVRIIFKEGIHDPPAGFRVFSSHQWEHKEPVTDELADLRKRSYLLVSE